MAMAALWGVLVPDVWKYIISFLSGGGLRKVSLLNTKFLAISRALACTHNVDWLLDVAHFPPKVEQISLNFNTRIICILSLYSDRDRLLVATLIVDETEWNITPLGVFLYTIREQEEPFKALYFEAGLEFDGISDVLSLPQQRFVTVQHYHDLLALHYAHPDGSFEKEVNISDLCNAYFVHTVNPFDCMLYFSSADSTIVCYDTVSNQMHRRVKSPVARSGLRGLHTNGELLLCDSVTPESAGVFILNLENATSHLLSSECIAYFPATPNRGKYLVAVTNRKVCLYHRSKGMPDSLVSEFEYSREDIPSRKPLLIASKRTHNERNIKNRLIYPHRRRSVHFDRFREPRFNPHSNF